VEWCSLQAEAESDEEFFREDLIWRGGLKKKLQSEHEKDETEKCSE